MKYNLKFTRFLKFSILMSLLINIIKININNMNFFHFIINRLKNISHSLIEPQ